MAEKTPKHPPAVHPPPVEPPKPSPAVPEPGTNVPIEEPGWSNHPPGPADPAPEEAEDQTLPPGWSNDRAVRGEAS